MIDKTKSAEILLSVLSTGKADTCIKYSLTDETLKRYLREAKKHHGNIETFATMASMYSSDELKSLVESKPDTRVKNPASISFDCERVKFLALTDSHVGSKYTNESYISAAIDEGIAQGCQFMAHAGDVTEGMSGRDGHVYELAHIGYKEQRKASIELFKRWPGKAYMISGNHDLWYMAKGDIGGDIVEDICAGLPDAVYLGAHEGDIDVNGVKVRLWHGEDTGSYATSYRLQKLIESFTGGEKPSALITGHTHKAGYFFERNIHAVTAGSIQSQSGWMRRKRLAAHCGFYVITMGIRNKEIIYFEPRFYPFYK